MTRARRMRGEIEAAGWNLSFQFGWSRVGGPDGWHATAANHTGIAGTAEGPTRDAAIIALRALISDKI